MVIPLCSSSSDTTFGKGAGIDTGRECIGMTFCSVKRMSQRHLSTNGLPSNWGSANFSMAPSHVRAWGCPMQSCREVGPCRGTDSLVEVFVEDYFIDLTCSCHFWGMKELLTRIGLVPVSNKLAHICWILMLTPKYERIPLAALWKNDKIARHSSTISTLVLSNWSSSGVDLSGVIPLSQRDTPVFPHRFWEKFSRQWPLYASTSLCLLLLDVHEVLSHDCLCPIHLLDVVMVQRLKFTCLSHLALRLNQVELGWQSCSPC